MTQFNLLPDVKLQYVKANRLKRMVLLIAVAVSAVSLFVFVLCALTVYVVQAKTLRDLDHDITANTKTLKSVPDLDKILTVQNQLNTLTGLHDNKVVSSRLFSYLSQLTPDGDTISTIDVDYLLNTITLSGDSTGLDRVNVFVDTLKATQYKVDGATGTLPPAFSQVVLSSYATGDKGVTYSTTFSFDPAIFSNNANVTLNVPTGSVSNTSALFKKAGN
jgi:hypothetical protein